MGQRYFSIEKGEATLFLYEPVLFLREKQKRLGTLILQKKKATKRLGNVSPEKMGEALYYPVKEHIRIRLVDDVCSTVS